MQKNLNIFCYTSGELTTTINKKSNNDFIERCIMLISRTNCGLLMFFQYNQRAPATWTSETQNSYRFSIPMYWREPQNHGDDCYFCPIDTNDTEQKEA